MIAALAMLGLVLLPQAASAQTADKALRDKDPATREAAVKSLTQEGGAKAGQWLLKILDDDDWGVVAAAARGLGIHGERGALKPLIKLCLEAPLLSLREEAAKALVQLDGLEAVKAMEKKLSSKKLKGQAAMGMAMLSQYGAFPEDLDGLQKILKHKKSDEFHPVAARALMACASSEEKPEVLRTLMASERLLIRSQAAEGLAASPDGSCVPVLVEMLKESGWNSVVRRRLVRALVACFGAIELEAARGEALEKLIGAGLGKELPGAWARARFAAWGGLGDKPVLTQDQALEQLKSLATSGKGRVRAEAYRAATSLTSKESLVWIAESLADETADVCIEPLVRTWMARKGYEEEDGRKALIACLSAQRGKLAGMESLCVAASRPEFGDAESALKGAINGQPWELAATAAVAVGKSRVPNALSILLGVAEESDWRLRGAAATGLMHLATPASFEALRAMTEDANPSVALTADFAMQRLAGREGQGKPAGGWDMWWDAHKEKANLRQREKSLDSLEKYGYDVPDSLIYTGLDVVVVPGRGDHIESVLKRLHIQFRTVEAGQLAKEGLHPLAILIVGCTGELAAEDMPIVQWYVRTGGALFTSCWSLTYTANRAFPGHIRKYESGSEVMDKVATQPVAQGSAFLNGVFAGGSIPIYKLEGAHLIEVVDPLRTEVLIDSPEAAERHGSGEMAAWFPVGHGTVLDSVNHFDLQGLTSATELKGAEELQAYAMNHMGYSLDKLRQTKKERWWKSRTDAAKEVDDLSAFRLLTNFVREKRLRGD